MWMQHGKEAFDWFLTDLKIKAKTCSSNARRDFMIHDHDICDKRLREWLIWQTELTSDYTVKLCQSTKLERQEVMQSDVDNSSVMSSRWHFIQRLESRSFKKRYLDDGTPWAAQPDLSSTAGVANLKLLYGQDSRILTSTASRSGKGGKV